MKLLKDYHDQLQNLTVFLRVDINCPIYGGRIHGTGRIKQIVKNLDYLKDSKVVMATHQGRVTNEEFIELDEHAEILTKECGRRVKYVRDVIGDCAINAIQNMKNGDIILLDNLRFCAEENVDYKTNIESSKTIFVKRLSRFIDACVLDAFPCAHRRHPSITGFPSIGIDTYAGLSIGDEIINLEKIKSVTKSPRVIVLGGSKIKDRLNAMTLFLENGMADHILLTGSIGCLFLNAQARLDPTVSSTPEIRDPELVKKAHILMENYPGKIHTPIDLGLDVENERIDVDVRETFGFGQSDDIKNVKISDIGPKTVEYFSKIISSAGMVFMSGPAGIFEIEKFTHGTNKLLSAISTSMATTIISGGHLSTALRKLDLVKNINHVSTAGGALVLYMTGSALPMLVVLNVYEKGDVR